MHEENEGEKGREAKNILVIKKENENVYYLYNSENQIFERIDKKELLKQPIKYHRPPARMEDISIAIDSLEKRLDEKERNLNK